MKIEMQPLTDDELARFRAGTCPDCKRRELREGPHGGLSVNYKCAGCGIVFNDTGPFGVDRIIETGAVFS